MTDGRLSRRERRELEETGATPVPGAGARNQGPDTGTLSRRDRRRLERADHPMETWTAEEEMIATGQIPTLTPEMIRQHEIEAKSKAEQAAAEAEARSQELRRLGMADVSAASHAAATGEYRRTRSESDDGADSQPQDAPAAPSPDMIRAMFPPGSVQARAAAAQMEAAARAAESSSEASEQPANAAPGPASSGLPTRAAPSTPPGGLSASGDDPAEEIRRLTAAAMASMERASGTEGGSAAGAPANPASGGVPSLAEPEPVANYEAPGTQQPRYEQELAQLPDSPEANPDQAGGAQATHAEASAPAWGEVPIASAPVPQEDPNSYPPIENVPQPDFAAIYGGTPTGGIPTGGTPIGGFTPVTQNPAGPDSASQSPPSQNPPQNPAPQNSLPPSPPQQGQNMPGPAFPNATPGSGGTFTPGGLAGQFSPAGGSVAIAPPPGTGAVPVVRKPPELPKDTRPHWAAQLAVVFAIMFALGVVTYNAWLHP